jgi:hypothetical protein
MLHPANREQVIADGEQAIDRLFMPLATEVRRIVRAKGNTPLTPLDRIRLMRQVDEALVPVFGRFPGDLESALADVIVAHCRVMRKDVWHLTASRLKAQLRRHRDLMEVLEEPDD